MKKIISLVATAFVVVMFISSCSKAPNKVLVKKDGKWNASYTYTFTVGGTSTTDTGTYTATFKDDGTGTSVQSGTTTNFTWSYDKKDKKMEITITTGGITTTDEYAVEEMKSKSERWTRSDTSTSGGITYTTNQVIDFTRAD